MVERVALTDWQEVADTVRAAAHEADQLDVWWSGQLAELLTHLGDELADETAAEVEWPARVHGRRTVAASHGMGLESDVWTAALALARALTGRAGLPPQPGEATG